MKYKLIKDFNYGSPSYPQSFKAGNVKDLKNTPDSTLQSWVKMEWVEAVPDEK